MPEVPLGVLATVGVRRMVRPVMPAVLLEVLATGGKLRRSEVLPGRPAVSLEVLSKEAEAGSRKPRKSRQLPQHH